MFDRLKFNMSDKKLKINLDILSIKHCLLELKGNEKTINKNIDYLLERIDAFEFDAYLYLLKENPMIFGDLDEEKSKEK